MFETEIQRGIEQLRKRVPNFLSLVDLDTLDMRDATQCVLGQIAVRHKYGDYYTLLSVWRWTSFDAIRCGFMVDARGMLRNFDILTDEWKATLTALIEAGEQ